METKTLVSSIALLSLLSGMVTATPLGTAFTYQGNLNDGGNPASGSYDLKFTLYDAGAGPGVVGGPITNAAVAVSNGLFSATLDFGAGVFTGDARWLEIGVRTNGGGAFMTLTPRQPMTPSPYALYATAAPLADGSVTSAKILDGTITGADMANNTVTSVQLGDDVELGSISANGELTLWSDANNLESVRLYGATHTISILDNSGDQTVSLNGGGASGGAVTLWGPDGTLRANLNGSSSGASFLLRDAAATATVQLRGDLGGEIDAAQRFNVVSALGGLTLAQLERHSGGAWLKTYDEAGILSGYFGSSAGSGGFVQLYTGAGNLGLRLDGDDGGAGFVAINGTNGVSRVELDGDAGDGGGTISVRNMNSSNRVFIDGQGSGGGGQIIAYAGDGGTGVNIYGDSGGGGLITVYNTNSSSRLYLDGLGSYGGGWIGVYANDGSSTLSLQGDNGSGAGLVEVRNNVSSTRVSLQGANASGGGQISLNGPAGVEGTRLATDAYGGEIRLYDDAGAATVLLDSSSGGGGYGGLYTADGHYGLFFDGDVGGAGTMYVYNTNGTQVITLDGSDADGNGRVTTQVLQITGGSDLSENFNVRAESALQPGMVVCIDAERPGELAVSTKAYDRTVAGVISGAGGVKPGMLMGQSGTKADGKHPVALTGRVFCLADAANGAIQPGDLMTTSATPGHAMKVTDHAQAQGAIIGKAMTPLGSGKGLVLVLVSLQ